MRNFLSEICKPLMYYVKEINEKNNLIIVRFKGDIDSQSIPCLQLTLEKEISNYMQKNLLVDFKDVKRVDSATFAAIIFILDQLKKNNKKLGVININQLFIKYLEVDDLTDKIKIYPSEQEAVNDLSL
ncbi:MAG: STAS domain-containing protein [Candidatus Omnitrophica bacterium]|nr:STAS domain-containing protein [Candidatus Omnitrophota bacterium]